MSKLRTAGLLLIAGSAVTFALHFLEAPEELYRWLYHHLLSGLDVPKDPSNGTVEAVRDVSLFGGILELALGLVLLGVDLGRGANVRAGGAREVSSQTASASVASLPKTMAVARVLASLVVLMAVLGAIDAAVTDVQLFDLEGELKDGPNLMVVASGGVLFVAAALALKLARSEAESTGSRGAWYPMAGLFAFMGVDELATIHEHVDEWTGVAWQVIYLPVVIAGAAVWWILFKRLRASDVRLATGWALAAGFWAFSQFLEVLFVKAGVGPEALKLDVLMPPIEELSELTGSSLFLLVSLGLLESRRLLRYQAPVPSGVGPHQAARDPASRVP